jgi:hypothetical protein
MASFESILLPEATADSVNNIGKVESLPDKIELLRQQHQEMVNAAYYVVWKDLEPGLIFSASAISAFYITYVLARYFSPGSRRNNESWGNTPVPPSVAPTNSSIIVSR